MTLLYTAKFLEMCGCLWVLACKAKSVHAQKGSGQMGSHRWSLRNLSA